jgi:hypothetical protein
MRWQKSACANPIKHGLNGDRRQQDPEHAYQHALRSDTE